MLVVRPVPVIKYGVQPLQVRRVRTKPRIYIFKLYRNDASVVPRSSDLRRWLVGDGSTLPSAASEVAPQAKR
jgi:hypothetical protein